MKDKVCGIYMIRNNINGKVYIGQSYDIYGRWEEHLCALRGDYHVNNHLQSSWNKYKEYSFEFSIVEECKENELNNREIYWISKYDSYHNGYNQTLGGEGIRGYKHSNETKKKMSECHTGDKNPMYGKCLSEETRQKLSALRSGENHPMYGKHPSQETLKRLSESHIGFNQSKETREKISKTLSHAVYCPELDEIFLNAAKAAEKYGISQTSIRNCCKGKQKSAGKHPVTGIPLRWVYNDEREKLKEIIYNRTSAVYCIELNERFDSIAEAGKKYNINPKSISECCRGTHKSAGKHPVTGEKLHWVYADEMNNSSVA